MTRKLHLMFFAHQPFFIPNTEVLWRMHSSYIPLLDAFAERGIPLTLAITGGLLRRLASIAPDFIALLKQRIADETVTLAGTTAHHPILPNLSTRWAEAQIQEEIKVRSEHDLPKATLFWPTELAWSHRVAQLAHEAGYRHVVVDARCCDHADAMPLWRLNRASLVPDIGGKRLCRHGIYSLEVGAAEMNIWPRDGELAHALVHIVRAEAADEDAQLTAFLDAYDRVASQFAVPGTPVFLADDIERIFPNAIARFLDLLDGLMRCGVEFVSADRFAATVSRTVLRYIPAGTMEESDAPWSATTDDRWFHDHLQRVAAKVEGMLDVLSPRTSDDRQVRDKLLQLQDSGFYFWHYVSRTRRPFYEELRAIEKWAYST